MKLSKRPLVREILAYTKKQLSRDMHKKIAEQIVKIAKKEIDKKEKPTEEESTNVPFHLIQNMVAQHVHQMMDYDLRHFIDDEVHRQLNKRGLETNWRRGIAGPPFDNSRDRDREDYEILERERRRSQAQMWTQSTTTTANTPALSPTMFRDMAETVWGQGNL